MLDKYAVEHMQEHIILCPYTTFKLGGPADFFVSVQSESELVDALTFAKETGQRVHMLGGGSNIIFSDDGFRGLVIKVDLCGVSEVRKEGGGYEVIVGAGVVWDEFVSFCIENEWYGVENLSGIPGTVGAVPIQNVGAYGVEVKDVILWVEVLDTETFKKKRMTNKACKFSYRDSVFKKEKKGRYVITRVCFSLKKDKVFNIEYGDLQKTLLKEKNLTLKLVRDTVLAIRKTKFPDLKEVGTAGSFFKNPVVSLEKSEELQLLFPELPTYPYSKTEVKISLAYILDRLGVKDMSFNNLSVHQKQPLVLCNGGKATSNDVKKFSEKIKKLVLKKTGIVIEEEITFVT